MRTRTDTGGGGGSIGGSIGLDQVAFGVGPDQIGGSDNFKFYDATGIFHLQFGGRDTFLIDPDAEEYGIGRFNSGVGFGVGMQFLNHGAYGYMIKGGTTTGGGDNGIRFQWVGTVKKYSWGDVESTDGGTYLAITDQNKGFQVRGSVSTLGPTGFTGGGLNDITLSGSYTGAGTPTFTVTLQETDVQLMSTVSQTGPFDVGDTVSGDDTLSTGTIVHVAGSFFWIKVDMGGNFATDTGITNTTVGPNFGNTAVSGGTTLPGLSDVVTFTDGLTVADWNLIGTPDQIMGVTYSAGSDTGHLVGDIWDAIVFSTTDLPGASWDFVNRIYGIGDMANAGAGTKVRVRESDRHIDLLGGIITRNQYEAPVDGATVTVLSSVRTLIIDGAGAFLALTVNMPSLPDDGQEVTVSSTQAVTTLTMGGGIVLGAPASFTADDKASWKFCADINSWVRTG